ncbi:MAG: hypothetical protein M3O50_09390 [Myxococcota bacterium]|nr:hypothetical protein [Myxococcota bacterium]
MNLTLATRPQVIATCFWTAAFSGVQSLGDAFPGGCSPAVIQQIGTTRGLFLKNLQDWAFVSTMSGEMTESTPWSLELGWPPQAYNQPVANPNIVIDVIVADRIAAAVA